jgi:hypothetical protein
MLLTLFCFLRLIFRYFSVTFQFQYQWVSHYSNRLRRLVWCFVPWAASVQSCSLTETWLFSYCLSILSHQQKNVLNSDSTVTVVWNVNGILLMVQTQFQTMGQQITCHPCGGTVFIDDRDFMLTCLKFLGVCTVGLPCDHVFCRCAPTDPVLWLHSNRVTLSS